VYAEQLVSWPPWGLEKHPGALMPKEELAADKPAQSGFNSKINHLASGTPKRRGL
jgi:hypothetical protein